MPNATLRPAVAALMLTVLAPCALAVPSEAARRGLSVPASPTTVQHASAAAFDFLAPPYRRGHRLFEVSHRPNWISSHVAAARNQGYLFVADEARNVVDIFPKYHARTPIGTISNGVASPDGLAVDRSSNLYVTNLGNATVTVYAPPYTGAPVTTYSKDLTEPVAVAVGRSGKVYVSNFSSGQLVEYPPHSTTPSKVISLFTYLEGLALDDQNNLYVAFNHPSGPGDVLKFAPGSSTGTDLGTIVGFCGGVAVDDSGNLLVADQYGNPPSVDVFPPGMTSPSQVIANGFYDPYGLALDDKNLYVGDSSPQQTVQQISYPAGVTVDTVSGFEQLLGVAVTKRT